MDASDGRIPRLCGGSVPMVCGFLSLPATRGPASAAGMVVAPAAGPKAGATVVMVATDAMGMVVNTVKSTSMVMRPAVIVVLESTVVATAAIGAGVVAEKHPQNGNDGNE